MSGKFRVSIGLVVDWLLDPYQNSLLKGAADYACERDANLFVFEGGSINSPLRFEAERNIAYDLVSRECIDGLIVATGTISHFVGYQAIVDFCARYSSMPMVSIAYEVENIPSILVDNTHGMKELMEHLIGEHHFRRFAFIKGMEGNQDARDRYAVFLSCLNEHGIPFDENLAAPGNFNFPSGVQAVKKLFRGRNTDIEAIVSANDIMAFGALQELETRGIKVPDHIAVTGFDSVSLGLYSSPPLTTVKQPVYEQGRLAAEMLLDLMEGKNVPLKKHIPTKMVIRKSCGCFSSIPFIPEKRESEKKKAGALLSEHLDDVLSRTDQYSEKIFEFNTSKDISRRLYDLGRNFIKEVERGEISSFIMNFRDLLGQIEKSEGEIYAMRDFISDLRTNILACVENPGEIARVDEMCYQSLIHIGEMTMLSEKYRHNELLEESKTLNYLRRVLQAELDIEKQLDAIKVHLPELGIKSCYIFLYQRDKERILDQSRPIFAYNENGFFDIGDNGAFFPSKKLAPPGFLPQGRQYSILVEVFKELGYMLFEIDPSRGRLYGLLRDIIGSALLSAFLFGKVQSQRNDLGINLENMRKAMGGFVQTMALTVETRDPYTAGHQRRVSDLARSIAQEMNLPKDKVECIRMAGIIHDLGKIHIPAEILNRPGKLDDLEFSIIKRHPKVAYDILKNVEFPWPLAEIIYQHHERLDGSGYPRGLKASEISPEAKILMVADVVEAMASHRPYRESLGIEPALEEIQKHRGVYYEPDVVDACVRLFRKKGYAFRK